MAKSENNLFISWSGKRSLHVARALRDWIPKVVQAAKPWMSEEDIPKGARGLQEVARALEGIKVGISCLTAENLQQPWILFEAGALSKTIDDRTRLCTYLVGGLRFQDVEPPLGIFQATQANMEDTRKLLATINEAVSKEPLQKIALDDVFEAMWPKLDSELQKLPQPEAEPQTNRTLDEMVAEILEITRADSNRRRQVDWMDEYLPLLKEFFPFLEQVIRAAKQAGVAGPELTTGSPGQSRRHETEGST